MNILVDNKSIYITSKNLKAKRFFVQESAAFFWNCYGQPQELFVVIKHINGLKPGQYIRKFSNGAFFLTKEYMVEYEYRILLLNQIDFLKHQHALLKVA